ncbi:sensor histidine kinase [Paenibacillus sp. GCM10027626]|uniref:sensor histidine kinase n=1 Tax=Paenibacillus sp. GCM10027626 TaxID=3273411 RepID=UPI003639F616
MKPSFRKTVLIGFMLFAALSAVYLSALIYYEAGRTMVGLALLFITAAAVLYAAFLLAIRKQTTTVLQQLTATIQSLLLNRQEAVVAFSITEDTAVSKLQAQILKLSRMLTAQRERYRQDSEEVKALISDISHQLKTPLANLRMYNELLLDATLPADKRGEFTGHMQNQLEKLSWLLDSLIQMSRIETGIIAIVPEKRPLASTVLTAIKQAYPAAQQKGIEIKLQGGPSAELALKHDPKWTGEAIFNLIDNAIKYSKPSASVEIAIIPYELFVRIDVRDQGAGIAEEELGRIFARFYRGEQAKAVQGVGIGLYLARKIVAAQGGYIKAASVVGEGSTFSLFLPNDRDEPAPNSG